MAKTPHPKLDPEFREPTPEERDALRRHGNQYFKLSATLVEQGEIAKAEYESECRRIFRQYIPQAENGRLRDHYRAFIARTSKMSSRVRFAILDELKKYDLANVVGLQARFNREKDPLTEEKLLKIEREVSSR